MVLKRLTRPFLRSVSSFERFGRASSQSIRKKNPYLSYKSMGPNNAVVGTAAADTAVASGAKELYKPLVWVDCEMTGLDHTKDQIIEICCIVTDRHLNIIDNNCYESVIHCDEQVMGQMNEWCIEHHGKSGLTRKVIDSAKTREQVEDELLQFIRTLIPQSRVGVLAGNTVHMDRLFMLKDFPKVVDHLFYRIVDVSSLMEISFRHNPALANVAPRKDKNHTAKSDILESIEQLRWYRDNYLKSERETQAFVAQQEQKLRLELERLPVQEKVQSEPPSTEKRAMDLTDQPVLKSRKL